MPKIKKIRQKKVCHQLQGLINYKFDFELYELILRQTDIHKLTYSLENDKRGGKDSFKSYILNAG